MRAHSQVLPKPSRGSGHEQLVALSDDLSHPRNRLMSMEFGATAQCTKAHRRVGPPRAADFRLRVGRGGRRAKEDAFGRVGGGDRRALATRVWTSPDDVISARTLDGPRFGKLHIVTGLSRFTASQQVVQAHRLRRPCRNRRELHRRSGPPASAPRRAHGEDQRLPRGVGPRVNQHFLSHVEQAFEVFLPDCLAVQGVELRRGRGETEPLVVRVMSVEPDPPRR